jgi:hypothetical protein
MRTWKIFTLMAIALAPLLQASPSIIINSDPPNPTVIVNNFFSFAADSAGGGDFSFVNGSNAQWIQLDVFVSLPQLGPITCGPGPFITCTPTPLAPGSAMPLPFDIVFGPAAAGGIAPGVNFSIDLNDNGATNTDPSGSGSWGANALFNVQITTTTATPEPSVWGLSGLGLSAGLMLFWRRRLVRG